MSRRAILAAAGSPGVPASLFPARTSAATLTMAWFALDKEIASLVHRQGELEGDLFDDPTWAGLSVDQRNAKSAQIGLDHVLACLDAVQARQHECLDDVMAAAAKDAVDAVAKLSIVLTVIPFEHYPECHRLIEDAKRMLAAYACPHCKAGAPDRAQMTALIADAATAWEWHNKV